MAGRPAPAGGRWSHWFGWRRLALQCWYDALSSTLPVGSAGSVLTFAGIIVITERGLGQHLSGMPAAAAKAHQLRLFFSNKYVYAQALRMGDGHVVAAASTVQKGLQEGLASLADKAACQK